MKIKKSTWIMIAVIVLILVFLFIRNSGKKKNIAAIDEIPTPTLYTESALEAKKQEAEVHGNIKKAMDAVEKDYKDAYSKYDKYKRSDFYNPQRLNEKMENGEIEFVNSDEVNMEYMYDLGGVKIEEIPGNMSNLSDKNSFDTGNLLLRCKSNMGIYTFYYLITIGNNGLEKYNYIFYTENENFDELNNELLFEDDLEEINEFGIE